MNTPHPLLRRFGIHLRHERLRRDLSQEELARRAKLSRNFVGMLERGERNVTLTSLESLARGLGLERWELVKF